MRILVLIFVLIFAIACQQSNSKKHSDTTTSGKVTISVDESLKPIVEAQKDVFEALYPNAKLNMIYTNEYDAINLLTNDSARIAIVTREMLPNEKSNFDARKIVPRNILIGYDAIAIILNRQCKDTIFTLAQIKSLLDGSYQTWKDVSSSNPATPLRIIFDDAKSGAVRYLKDSLLKDKPLASHCYALKSNKLVIEEVEKNKNTIGIIGVSWISDRDDSITSGFLKRIRVADIVPINPENAEAKTMKPYQAYIALKQYPLYRKIFIINPEGRYGLGTGFASFINSDKGQRIILKSGLVPANVPVRILKFKND